MSFENVRVSGSVFANFDCTWVIPNFSTLNAQVGSETRSKPFQLQEYSPRLDLSICPGGEGQGDKGYVACYVNHHGRTKLSMKFNCLTLRNYDGKILWNLESDEWSVESEGRGFTEMIKRKELIRELINDVLIVSAGVSYCSNCVQDSTKTNYFATVDAPMVKLIEGYESLSTNDETADTKIWVGRKKKIPVHSAILSARSEVFENDMQDRGDRRVQIKDFKKQAVDALMQFVYTGSVKDLDMVLAFDLLRAADTYQMDDLKQYCSDYLISHLHDGNVAQILVNADTCNARVLKAKAVQYFRQRNDRALFNTHIPLLERHPHVLHLVLEQTYLYYD